PGRTGWNVIPGLGHTGHGMTTDEYLAAEMYRRESMEFAKNYMQKRYGRKQIVKVQKTQTGWLWTCRICDHFFMSTKRSEERRVGKECRSPGGRARGKRQ